MHANKKLLGLAFYRCLQLRRQGAAENSTGLLLPAEKEFVVMDARSERSSKREGERSWAKSARTEWPRAGAFARERLSAQ